MILFLETPTLLVSNREERRSWECYLFEIRKSVFALNLVLLVTSEGHCLLSTEARSLLWTVNRKEHGRAQKSPARGYATSAREAAHAPRIPGPSRVLLPRISLSRKPAPSPAKLMPPEFTWLWSTFLQYTRGCRNMKLIPLI